MLPKRHARRNRPGFSSEIGVTSVAGSGAGDPEMCLAVPGKVLSVEGEDPAFRSALVDFCGVHKTVSLAFIPEIQPGDFIQAHVGFAVSRIDERQAAQTYQDFLQIGALSEDDLAPPASPPDRGNGAFE
jgi:hydrogenase expression/formation protein HypC